MGEIDIESLTKDLGVTPTHAHKKGEVNQIGEAFDSDMWSLTAPLKDSLPLDKHLNWLVKQLKNRYKVLEKIKTDAKVDIFCSFTSGEQSGFSLSPKALSIFHDLQITMEVSLILLAVE